MLNYVSRPRGCLGKIFFLKRIHIWHNILIVIQTSTYYQYRYKYFLRLIICFGETRKLFSEVKKNNFFNIFSEMDLVNRVYWWLSITFCNQRPANRFVTWNFSTKSLLTIHRLDSHQQRLNLFSTMKVLDVFSVFCLTTEIY